MRPAWMHFLTTGFQVAVYGAATWIWAILRALRIARASPTLFKGATLMADCTEEQIITLIRATLKANFGVDLADQPDTAPIGEIGIDSMAVLDIVLAVEESVGRKVRKFDLQPNPTLLDIAAMMIRNFAPEKAHGNA